MVCSPDARDLRWVGEEIALFRKLHPNRPVLAALVRGDHQTAFPDALTADGTEPLAADLRKEGDGKSLGFLKIIAGIAGVPLDTLIQRDAQRRVRRVTWITAAALAAMLVMGIMTTLAIQARNEAARQRAEAEGLVEYMLTDLREKLKGVGRLDVMNAVNERALVHYKRQGDLSTLPDDSLERRARILHAMGEDDEKRGAIDEASKKFLEAHRTTEAILHRKPNDPSAIFSHGQSEYWLGYLAFVTGDNLSARSRFEKYAEHAQSLSKKDESNVKWLREVGYAQGNLCSVSLAEKANAEDAINSCKDALDIMSKILKLRQGNPEAIADTANRHAWLADALVKQNKLKEAYVERLKEEKLLKSLGRLLDSNSDYQDRWVGCQINLIKLERRIPHNSLVENRIKTVATLVAKLSIRDPQNTRWQKFSAALEKLRRKGQIYGLRKQ